MGVGVGGEVEVIKPQWQSPNHSHPLLHKICGINCNAIFYQGLKHHIFYQGLKHYIFYQGLKHHFFLSAFPGISSSFTDIMFCDVSPSTNVTQVRHTA